MLRRSFLSGAVGAALVQPGGQGMAHAEAAAPGFHVLFGGDTNFAESYAPRAAAARGYSRPLSALAPVLKRADLAIVNLETPLTALRTPPHPARDYVHWSDPVLAPAALRAAGIDAVGLANNHAMDFGPQGLDDTLAAAGRQGLASFGAGRDRAAAAAPLLRDLTPGGRRRGALAVFGLFEHRRRYADDYGFYAGDGRPGANRLSPSRFARDVAALRRRVADAYVVAFVHWGKNYAWRTDEQRDTGRALIDAGADLVIGHHGHAMQEVERYRDRWILYGIGNLMFNAPGRFDRHPETPPFSLLVDLGFAWAGPPRLKAYPILSDNRRTGYRPRLATGAEAAQVFAQLSARLDPASAAGVRLGEDETGPCLILG